MSGSGPDAQRAARVRLPGAGTRPALLAGMAVVYALTVGVWAAWGLHDEVAVQHPRDVRLARGERLRGTVVWARGTGLGRFPVAGWSEVRMELSPGVEQAFGVAGARPAGESIEMLCDRTTRDCDAAAEVARRLARWPAAPKVVGGALGLAVVVALAAAAGVAAVRQRQL